MNDENGPTFVELWMEKVKVDNKTGTWWETSYRGASEDRKIGASQCQELEGWSFSSGVALRTLARPAHVDDLQGRRAFYSERFLQMQEAQSKKGLPAACSASIQDIKQRGHGRTPTLAGLTHAWTPLGVNFTVSAAERSRCHCTWSSEEQYLLTIFICERDEKKTRSR